MHFVTISLDTMLSKYKYIATFVHNNTVFKFVHNCATDNSWGLEQMTWTYLPSLTYISYRTLYQRTLVYFGLDFCEHCTTHSVEHYIYYVAIHNIKSLKLDTFVTRLLYLVFCLWVYTRVSCATHHVTPLKEPLT